MTNILDEYMPKVTTITGIFVILAILIDNYVVGGFYIVDKAISVSRLLTVNARATPIVTLVMSFSVILLYYRRLKGGDTSFKIKSICFYSGFALTFIMAYSFGPYSQVYTLYSRATEQISGSTNAIWVAVLYVSLLVRGYMVRSKEGALMAIVGLLEIWSLGAVGNIILPQLADIKEKNDDQFYYGPNNH